MKATIFFFYGEGSPHQERETTIETAERDVRYWLEKSPGCHEIERIVVVPTEEIRDFTFVIEKKVAEEAEYERKMAEREEERAIYERLKAKYETPTNANVTEWERRNEQHLKNQQSKTQKIL